MASKNMGINVPTSTGTRLRRAARYLSVPLSDLIELALNNLHIPNVPNAREVRTASIVSIKLHLDTVKERGHDDDKERFFKREELNDAAS